MYDVGGKLCVNIEMEIAWYNALLKYAKREDMKVKLIRGEEATEEKDWNFACNHFLNFSKESKIAALEAKLKMLEENSGEMSFTPDIGGPSKPTKIIYNYIEQKQKPGTSSGKASSS